MALRVQKYGGTSVGSIERIQAVAQRVARTVAQGHQVVVVVSAMGKETDRLLGLAQKLDPQAIGDPTYGRELDMLVSTGEQVSIALLAMALQQIGTAALSMTAAQVGIRTTTDHTRARILEIGTDRIWRHLGEGKVVIVAGFQGISSTIDLDITTLGRGGSDTTAVALAAALSAEVCEIYTDVPGVFTTDPRLVPQARLLNEITSGEMLELASLGAKVLHPRAVEIARNYGVKLKVLSSLVPPDQDQQGTVVLSKALAHSRSATGLEMVQAVDAVVLDRDQVKIVLLRVPDRPGIAAQLFQSIAAADINVDLILQSIHTTEGEDTNDIAFTIPRAYQEILAPITHNIAQQLGCPQVVIDTNVAKISLAGAGMIGRPGIAADMFQVLAEGGINLQMISMSEIRVSCVIAADRSGDAMVMLSEYFQLIPQSQRGSEPGRSRKPVRGVALDQKQSRLAILGVPDRPGSAATIFQKLAAAGVVVDTIIQSQREQWNEQGLPTNDIAFTVPQDQAPVAEQVLGSITTSLSAAGVKVDHAIAKVSVVGAEMESHPGVAARMFQTLAEQRINIEMIATSEIKISCVVRAGDGVRALQGIHEAFELEVE